MGAKPPGRARACEESGPRQQEKNLIFHTIYGLCIGAPAALPGFTVLPDWNGRPDVRIFFGGEYFSRETIHPHAEPLYVSSSLDENGRPVLCVTELPGKGCFLISYSDGARFALDQNGREIYADWPENLALEDACVYLAGPVLGFLLHLRGTVPLHASCISINDHAIAVMGAAGAGKSTTAAAFAQIGSRVVADDVVALKEQEADFIVCPGYPRVNLWGDSAQALFGEDRLPLIAPNWEKRFVSLDESSQFEKRMLRLGGIYVLRGREPGLAKPIIEGLATNSAFVALVANTYMNRVIPYVIRQREFAAIGRVATHVPIRTVRVPADPGKISLLRDAIQTDVSGLTG